MAEESTEKTITVAGVTFNASQVVSAVLEIDGRIVRIEPEEKVVKIGFGG